MKKIVSIFAILFLFSLNANAQSSEKTKYNDEIEQKISKSISIFSAVMDIPNETGNQFREIFGAKFTLLAKESVSDVDKQKMIKEVDIKLRALLNPYIINQLNEKNLYNDILNLK